MTRQSRTGAQHDPPAVDLTTYQYRGVIFGESESGKTQLLVRIAETLPTPVWLFDPTGELVAPPGGVVVNPPWQLAGAGKQTGPYHGDVDRLCQAAYQVGGVTVGIDESEQAIRNQVTPPWLYEILKRGRHCPWNPKRRPVGFLLVSQSPGDLPPACTAQVRDAFLFRLTGHRDLERVRLMGIEPEAVRNLPHRSFLHLKRGCEPHIHHDPYGLCPTKDVSQ